MLGQIQVTANADDHSQNQAQYQRQQRHFGLNPAVAHAPQQALKLKDLRAVLKELRQSENALITTMAFAGNEEQINAANMAAPNFVNVTDWSFREAPGVASLARPRLL